MGALPLGRGEEVRPRANANVATQPAVALPRDIGIRHARGRTARAPGGFPHARSRHISRTSRHVGRGARRDRAHHLEPGECRAFHHRDRHRQLDLASVVCKSAAAAAVAGAVEPVRRGASPGNVALAHHADAVPARRHHRRGTARRLHCRLLRASRLWPRRCGQWRRDPHRRGDQAAQCPGDRRIVRRGSRQIRLRHRRPQTRVHARRPRGRCGAAVARSAMPASCMWISAAAPPNWR